MTFQKGLMPIFKYIIPISTWGEYETLCLIGGCLKYYQLKCWLFALDENNE